LVFNFRQNRIVETPNTKSFIFGLTDFGFGIRIDVFGVKSKGFKREIQIIDCFSGWFHAEGKYFICRKGLDCLCVVDSKKI
jgi:hypothetical protein